MLVTMFFIGSHVHSENITPTSPEQLGVYRSRAEKGDPEAQYILGLCYYCGDGVPKNISEAAKWYRKAAEQGHAQAQDLLANFYATGVGVKKDYHEATRWFRKAAELGIPEAQGQLGIAYYNGYGVSKDYVEALKWWRKAAAQGEAEGQLGIGICYFDGSGVTKNEAEAYKWWLLAAEQGHAPAQRRLGFCYDNGEGIPKNESEAVKWYRRAAEQGDVSAQCNLGVCCFNGSGVTKDAVEAYKWLLLAAGQGEEKAKRNLPVVEQRMTREQIAEGQKLARKFRPRVATVERQTDQTSDEANTNPKATGTGFFITDSGFLITNKHVVEDASKVRLATSEGLINAKVVKVDEANDFALIKAEGKFAALPVASSRGMKMGASVSTVGFPNTGMQGVAPKLAKGEIAALSGATDDARYFQISAPLQPGNSGGALVDERGNVVGVVAGKLRASTALAASGALPENVNYAVKSSFLLGFLESVPRVANELKEPNTQEERFENVVKSAERAAVLILVY